MKTPAGLCLALLAALGAACEHAQPFGAADLGPNVPFDSTFPRQLTFGPGGDAGPAWLPDGSGIIYSFLRLDRPDHDRCLGILPAEGGRIERSICHQPVADDEDSTNALWSPAVGPDGVLAYVRESSRPGSLVPLSRELVVASLGAPDPGRVVLTFPYTASDGMVQGTATDLRWVDAHTLLFLAAQVTYLTGGGTPDTVLTPLEIMRVTVAADSDLVAPLAGTQRATSVALAGSDTAYLTFAGDSAVYAYDLAGGSPALAQVVHGVGAVIDAQRAGGRLFVVAGYDKGRGLGGQVFVLDPVADTLVSIDPQDFVFYRRAAVSPSGGRVATEGYAVSRVFVCETCPTDTIVDRVSKLWLLRAP